MIPLLASAFSAGLVSTVNPCGFAMLPAYLGYFMGSDESQGRPGALRSALRVGGLVSLGFIAVFGIAGAILAAGVRSAAVYIPWVAVVVGVFLVGLGIYTLRGGYLNVRLGSGTVQKTSSARSIIVFGVSYALASLSCTLPIFLALVAGTFTQASFGAGLAAFLAYGLGMSVVLMAVTVAIALGRDSIITKMRWLSRYVTKISGFVLIGAGVFIVWYWLTVLSSGAASLGSSSIVRWVDEASASVTGFIGDRPLLVGLVAAAFVAWAVVMIRRKPIDFEEDHPDRKLSTTP